MGLGVVLFRGVHNITVDAKGRMAMPSKQRERLVDIAEGQLVATIDTQNPCILIYPLSTWEKIEKEIQELPALNAAVRRFQRLTIGYASDLEFDGNGRVLLPQSLRQHAKIDKKVVLAGMGKKFELWSEEHWQAECDIALDEASSDDFEMPIELMGISL